MKKTILIALIAAVIVLVSYEGCKRIQSADKTFKIALDSLRLQNDSLKEEIIKETATVDSLMEVDFKLSDQLELEKGKITTITEYVDLSQKAVDTYSEKELVSSFNKRYPEDTITNPLPLAQPVLISAAKDLIALDGAEELLVVKDSIIGLQEDRIANKDSVISLQNKKEENYNSIVVNQDSQIREWRFQYNKSQLENHKLKIKNKFTKITSYILLGGLTYFLIAK